MSISLRLLVLAALLFGSACASSQPATTASTPDESAPPVAATPPAETTAENVDEAAVPVGDVDDLLAEPMAEDDPRRAGRFDSGKMWTFEYPPVDYLRETYGFEPDDAWFEQARLGALRIPGCSASFVSPQGLMLTNHHCVRGILPRVNQPGENLLDEGFYATALDAERQIPDYYADQLIAIEDVTDEVFAALEGAQTEAERADARSGVITAIEERLQEAGGDDTIVQVISLYNGGRYSAYTFRRYTDIRLVMVPELQLGAYGGDPDNFTYPRYSLDMSMLRAYGANGDPLASPNYFRWTDGGVEEGSVVFVIGNPGGTYRLETVAQLAFRRDVREPAVLAFLERRIDALQDYLAANPSAENADEIRNTISSLQNGAKLYGGRVEALEDEVIMARRQDTERQLREAIQADPELSAQYGDAIDQVAAIQAEKEELADAYRAFFLLTNPAYSSAVLRRGWLAYELLQLGDADGERAQALREQLQAIDDQPRGVQERLLAARLEEFSQYLGADDPLVAAVLAGRTPAQTAEAILRASNLATATGTSAAIASGSLSEADPAVQLAAAFYGAYQDYQSAWAGLTARETDVAERLGRARFAVYGTAIPPDATFSLRIADGVVSGYPYNGTVAPPYVTYYGLYDHYYAYGPGTDWDLPARWLTPPEGFDLETPVTFVSTADTIGGNSGSPLINTDLELVGLLFDGNIESLSGDYIYLDETGRSVAVDARGMLEALDDMYGADRLVLELTGAAFVPTEEAADAQASR